MFCPNDDAFAELCVKLGVSKMDLMSNDRIPAIIRSHIVEVTRPPTPEPTP